jgi:dienelactone hydrolase
MQDLRRGKGRGVDDLIATRNWLARQEYGDTDHLGIVGFAWRRICLLLAKKGLFQVPAPFYGKSPDRLEGAYPIVASYGSRDKVTAPEAARIAAEARRLHIL